MENIKVILNLITTFVFNLLFFLVLLKVIDKRRSKVFSLFVISMLMWSYGTAMFYSTSKPSDELFWAKFLYMACALIPPSFLYYALIYNESVKQKTRTIVLIFAPYLALLYLYFFTPYMITNIAHVNGVKIFQYGQYQYIWLVLFVFVFMLGFLQLSKLYRVAVGAEKEHLKHIIVGTLLGVSLISVTNVIMPLLGKCQLVWLGPSLASTLLFLVMVAALRNRLVDIRLAISNMSLFIIIYTFVIGIPLYIYTSGYHLVALIFMLILASTGNGFYDFLCKEFEKKILENQTRYQNQLLKASEGISQLQSVEEITQAIVKMIHEIMGLKNTALYFKEKGALKLKDKAGQFTKSLIEEVPADRFVTETLIRLGISASKTVHNQNVPALTPLNDNTNSLWVPIVHDKNLLALLIIGEKKDGTVFFNSDISVLNLVAHNMALVIKNAQYREEELARLKTEDALTRREFLDQIVSVMSHEIRNPNGVVLGQAEILHEFFEGILAEHKTDPVAEKAATALKIITDHAEKINFLLEKIRRYSQEHKIEVVPIAIAPMLANIEIFEHAILKKYPKVSLKKNIEPSLPMVLGDEILVEEVLINYISNAAHAVAHSKNENSTVVLSVARLDEKYVRCMVCDEGYGISPEVLKKLFHVPMTTKSNNEGTGLGLWNIRKITEMIGGHFGIDSPGEGLGARAWLDLRVAE
jgi:K+-sensing histidine kinase KdpD